MTGLKDKITMRFNVFVLGGVLSNLLVYHNAKRYSNTAKYYRDKHFRKIMQNTVNG